MSPEPQLTSEERYCADTFNGAVAAAAISAAWEIGLLEELDSTGAVILPDFAAKQGCHLPLVHTIALALSGRTVVDLDGDVARPGSGFAEVFRTKGFFYWLTRGSGEIFTQMPGLVRDDNRNVRPLRRDSGAISVACRSIARTFFDPPFEEMLAGIRFRKVVDLGCGSADRIVGLVRRIDGLSAIGIDVTAGALAVAGYAVHDEGLADRVSLVRDDVLNLSPRDEYRDVDLLTCFLMGHDFWPAENCAKTLGRMREVFPRAENLIIGDTARSTGVAAGNYPMFTLGFELVHSVMGQYLPTLDEWEVALADSGWRCVERRTIDLPAFSFIYRLVPA
jgi:SAM-dependent methyltransferase